MKPQKQWLSVLQLFVMAVAILTACRGGAPATQSPLVGQPTQAPRNRAAHTSRNHDYYSNFNRIPLSAKCIYNGLVQGSVR